MNYLKLFSILLSIAILFLVGFTYQTPQVGKEFMTIVVSSDGVGKNHVAYLSVKGKDYIEEKFTKLKPFKNAFDYNPVMMILEEYQRGGWKVVSSNLTVRGNDFYNYFLLEREKPSFK